MTWLPTFNQRVLSLSDTLSVQMASILTLSLAAGRFIAGQLMKKIKWPVLLTVFLAFAMLLMTEKFNVQESSHKADAEYGNVGARFEYVPEGGFGWTNASFLIGLHYLTDQQKATLNQFADPKQNQCIKSINKTPFRFNRDGVLVLLNQLFTIIYLHLFIQERKGKQHRLGSNLITLTLKKGLFLPKFVVY